MEMTSSRQRAQDAEGRLQGLATRCMRGGKRFLLLILVPTETVHVH